MVDTGMQRAKMLQRAKRRRTVRVIAAGVSLIVCVVSCFFAAQIGIAGRAGIGVRSASFDVTYYNQPVPYLRDAWIRRIPLAPEWLPSVEQLTHSLMTNARSQTVHLTALVLPLWPLPLVFGVLAAWTHRRVRRLSSPGCQSCGYDVSGLVTGVCPECGTACGGPC